VIHRVVLVVLILWFSFSLSILHNFLGAVIYAQLEQAYSFTDVVIAMFKRVFVASRESFVIDDETGNKIEDSFIETQRPKRQRLARGMQWLETAIPYIGYAAMLAFVVAYTAVPLFLLRLW
jgi:hypothetical protein